MELCHLSTEYFVRKLNDNDIDRIYNLCQGNTLFYRFHPPVATRESIAEDMRALAPGKGYDDKFYIGFFQNDNLAAVMDLICGYPGDKVAYIGLFMVAPECQGKGVGTKMIGECCSYWKRLGYQKVRLGVDKGNPQSSAFWKKNHFAETGEEHSDGTYAYVLMERTL